jgi:drug/metabolite transporter (DMT)-like permease
VFGVMMAASSVLFIKASTLTPAVLAASRLLIAALILIPLWLRERRRDDPRPSWWDSVRPVLLPALFLGLHFISWNAGARGTLAGNASLVVNLVPVVMPVLAWAFLSEKLNRRELVGTGVALVGVAVLGFSDYQFSPEHLVGDGVCFGSMCLYSVYLIAARKRVQPGRLFSYLTPLYGTAGLICLTYALVFDPQIVPVTALDPWMVAGLVLGPTLLGHSIANWSMTRFRAQTVSLVNVTQFVFAGVMSFFVFGEVPKPLFYLTGALVVGGAVIAMAKNRKTGVKA